jgi:hypothetical protein
LAAPVGNQQKINVIRRLVMALSRLGVNRVEIMPDLLVWADKPWMGWPTVIVTVRMRRS